MRKKFKYYNNGIETIRVYENQEIPEGYVRGNLTPRIPWNKGKTAEIDERVKNNTDKCHSSRRENNTYQAWNKGLTKDSDERVAKNVEHAKETIQQRYGIDNVSQLPHEAWNKGLTKESDERVAKISSSRKNQPAWNKGKKTGSHWTEKSAEKRYQTQLKNGTLGINRWTKAEKEVYDILLELYSEDDIIPQYRDGTKYPFKCDFYITSEKLFVEVNKGWTHGGKPYDASDPECQKKLTLWQEKAKTSKYYQNAIYTWTDLDVRKLKILKDNNLNYKIIY